MNNSMRYSNKAIPTIRRHWLLDRLAWVITVCLLGVACRYDGAAKPALDVPALLAAGPWVPFCPEHLGGLPTPRPPAQIVGGDGADRLYGEDGNDWLYPFTTSGGHDNLDDTVDGGGGYDSVGYGVYGEDEISNCEHIDWT